MDAFLIWLFGAVTGSTVGYVIAGLMHDAKRADEHLEIGEWREP